jgi:hypothetical protein
MTGNPGQGERDSGLMPNGIPVTPNRIPEGRTMRFGMTDRHQPSVALPGTIKERLSPEDDPALWEKVLQVLAEDVSTIESINNGPQLYAEIGRCSHWLRPHQTRWTAAGGFAWPTGYGDGNSGFSRTGLPGFDWSVVLQFDPDLMGWVIPEKLPTKRANPIRVAVPSRTTRHGQAAVHTLWPAGTLDARNKRTVFYGFRSLSGSWELKASLDRRSRTDPA